MAAVATHAMSNARLHSIRRLGSLLPISITAAMPEGPATSGIAMGTMKGSPPGSSPIRPSGGGKIMRRPIRNSTMPPAMDTDSWRRCISSSAYLPPHRNTISTTSAMNSSRASTMRRRCSGKGLSNPRNTGMFPSGSRIRNSSSAAEAMVMRARRSFEGADRAAPFGTGFGEQFDAGLGGEGRIACVAVLVVDEGLRAQARAHRARLQAGDAHRGIHHLRVQHADEGGQAMFGEAVATPEGARDAFEVVDDEHHRAVLRLLQLRQARLREPPRCGEVDVHRAREHRRIRVLERRQAAKLRGAMQQAVEAAVSLADAFGQVGEIVGRGAFQVERIEHRRDGLLG